MGRHFIPDPGDWRTAFPLQQIFHRTSKHQWIHEHRFEERDGGMICLDHVRYVAPGGALLHRWFIRPDVEGIFRFRQAKLLELFGTPASQPPPIKLPA